MGHPTPIQQANTPDYTSIKLIQQATWGAGNDERIAVTLQITGEVLCEAMDLRAGQSVLDIAAGKATRALAAAHRFCDVTVTDYVPALLAQAKDRARSESLPISFQQADAESLPFERESFDHVMSTFGVMFGPNQRQARSELIRACTAGGKIGLANWTPNSFIGQLFKLIAQHVPPPAGLNSPALWGTEEFMHQCFGRSASDISLRTQQFVLRYRSPSHWLNVVGDYFDPTMKAQEGAADPTKLRTDILALIDNQTPSATARWWFLRTTSRLSLHADATRRVM